MHGAPLLCALAAEASGADLVYVCLPKIHQHVARSTSLNFQVHPFLGDEFSTRDIEPILELLATMDCAVMGPGLSRSTDALSALHTLIASSPCALVLDASALQPWSLGAAKGKVAVCTPHLGELERMNIAEENLQETATQSGVFIHLKGTTDRIAAPDSSIEEVSGGNAGLTVGGTGDALAGLIAGLLSQHTDPADACRIASTVIKRAGTLLAEERGYAYTARDVIAHIPMLLRSFD